MALSPTAAWPAAVRYAREVAVRTASRQARESHDRKVTADSARVLETPRFKAADAAKAQSRAKIQQIRERLNILRKLYAANPREMARAMAQLARELKAAVKAYKEAGGQAFGMSVNAAGGVIAAQAESAAATDEHGGEAGTAADPVLEAAGTPREVTVDEVARAARDLVGQDGLEFLGQVRDLVRVISDVLQASRGQAAIMVRDRKTDEAFEEADDSLKALGREMAAMEREIRANAPAAGTRLSIVA